MEHWHDVTVEPGGEPIFAKQVPGYRPQAAHAELPGSTELPERRDVELVAGSELRLVQGPLRQLAALLEGRFDGEPVALHAQLPEEPLR